MRLLPFVLATALALPAQAAIHPAEFTRHVPDQMQLRETARVVQEYVVDGATHRRVTLVGEVVAQKRASTVRIGQTVVIDYTVDLSARERAAEAHRKARGTTPGPQFMHEPDPPEPGAEGLFWANVAPAQGHWPQARRYAGAVADAGSDRRHGAVFVPASGQYTFAPVD